MKNESKLSKALEELKAEAERQNMSAEIIDNKVVIDGNNVIEVVDEPRTPVEFTPKNLDRLIFYVRNIYFAVGVICQTSGDLGSIPVVGLPLIWSLWHSGRGQYDTFNIVSSQRSVQGIPQATSFIATDNLSFLSMVFL